MAHAWLLTLGAILAVLTTFVAKLANTRAAGNGPTQFFRTLQWSAPVIPIVFAVSVLQFPRTITQSARWEWLEGLAQRMRPDQPIGALLSAFLIVVFSYLYAHRSTKSERRF